MNALLVDEALLSLKMPRPNRYVFGVLSERAEVLLRELENTKTTEGEWRVCSCPRCTPARRA